MTPLLNYAQKHNEMMSLQKYKPGNSALPSLYINIWPNSQWFLASTKIYDQKRCGFCASTKIYDQKLCGFCASTKYMTKNVV
mgnify:CR=1 FL=1